MVLHPQRSWPCNGGITTSTTGDGSLPLIMSEEKYGAL